jgi:hypothetical protein
MLIPFYANCGIVDTEDTIYNQADIRHQVVNVIADTVMHILDDRYWIVNTALQILDIGYLMQDSKCQILYTRCWIPAN